MDEANSSPAPDYEVDDVKDLLNRKIEQKDWHLLIAGEEIEFG